MTARLRLTHLANQMALDPDLEEIVRLQICSALALKIEHQSYEMSLLQDN